MDCGMEIKENEKNKVMHVSLPVAGGKATLMGSDSAEQSGKVNAGNNFSIALGAESEAEADELHKGLSADGGNAMMPMSKAPWGDYFGMVTDKFGTAWMISYRYPQQS
jgi:PhnB protein